MDSREPTAVSEEPDDYFDKYGITGEEGEDAEEWEREASKLYEWTQELSFNDDLIATPINMIGVTGSEVIQVESGALLRHKRIVK